MWECRKPKVLVEGPAGTGKTRGIIERDYVLVNTYSKLRILWVRATRESMTESVLWTLEEEVCVPGDELLIGSQEHRKRRSEYKHPTTGSVILPRGLDKPGKTYSQQYDLIRVFEAWEVTRDALEKLLRCLRNVGDRRLGYRQLMCDTNPADEYHHLNKAANRGDLHRICTTHKDNPVYWDVRRGAWTQLGEEYVEGTLASMTGARRANLYEGRWASAEGIILEEFSPGEHILEPDHELLPPLVDPEKPNGPREYEWYFASMDVGIRHPGVLMVWGVHEERIFCLVEVYRTGWDQEEWADLVVELNHEYALQAVVVDSQHQDYIRLLNKRFRHKKGKDDAYLARNAKKEILPGIDLMRWMLKNKRLYWLSDRMKYGRDAEREKQDKPCSSTEEIPGWVWCLDEEDKPVREKPDPTCPDHGIDATRYACRFLDLDRDMTPPREKPKYPKGTVGDVLDFAEAG